MSEEALDIESQDSDSAVASLVSEEPKLWAGKFKSVEDLEDAYKNSAKVFQENQSLKDQISQFQAPESYSVPEHLALREAELGELQDIAKKAGLTQDQFVKTAEDMQHRLQKNVDRFESAKAKVGEETLNVLDDYVKQRYPESLQGVIYNQLIKDEKARSEAMTDRDKMLNSEAPGVSTANPGAQSNYDGLTEMKKARLEYMKSPTENNKSRYINIAAELGHERFKEQG